VTEVAIVPVNWLDNLDQAKEQARQPQRLMLLDFVKTPG
jgi:hypothetical protein